MRPGPHVLLPVSSVMSTLGARGSPHSGAPECQAHNSRALGVNSNPAHPMLPRVRPPHAPASPQVSYPAWQLCSDGGAMGSPSPSRSRGSRGGSRSRSGSPARLRAAAGPACPPSECVVGATVDMASHVYMHSSPAGRALCEFECLHSSRDYTAPGGGGAGAGAGGGGTGWAPEQQQQQQQHKGPRDPVLSAVLHHLGGGGPAPPPFL